MTASILKPTKPGYPLRSPVTCVHIAAVFVLDVSSSHRKNVFGLIFAVQLHRQLQYFLKAIRFVIFLFLFSLTACV